MLVRYESFGAWVKLESTHAIVALDRDGIRALGLDGGALWNDDSSTGAAVRISPPIEVHLAVTARCGAGCKGCYLDATPDREERSYEELVTSLDAIRDAGVFTVAFGGGEPTQRTDLGRLARECRERGMTPVLTTSGHGLSPAKLERLKEFAQVNVSYDGRAGSEAYQSVRGYDGAASAEEAIGLLVAAGIPVGVNVVLTRASFPHIRSTILRARDLGAREAQLLRYKPAGRAATLDYLTTRLTLEQSREVGPLLRSMTAELSAGAPFSLRIDCAMVPFLSADDALYEAPTLLTRWGVMGCEAAGALVAVKADGRVSPCSFAESGDPLADSVATSVNEDRMLRSFRAYHDGAKSEPCASCNLRSVCKGGCQVVATHLGGNFAPDPECPRVLAHSRR